MKQLILILCCMLHYTFSIGQSRYFDGYSDRDYSRPICTSQSCVFSDLEILESYYGSRVDVTILDGSIEALKKQFNATQNESRFIALLSPECPNCIEGAIAIRDGILDKYPEKKINIIIVWVDMFRGDDYQSAKKTARILDDPRVNHFYDMDGIVGPAFARALGAGNLESRREPAWDLYMFYDKEIKWEAAIPVPDQYTHQLNRKYDHWADRRFYYRGPDLYEELIDLARKY